MEPPDAVFALACQIPGLRNPVACRFDQHAAPVHPQSKALIAVLRTQSPQQIASLMAISDKLAALNVARYEAWSPKFSSKNARQAIMAFNGDVYDGLQAPSLSAKQLDWAQSHLCMLSGLYGVLRPLDLMQPYRLEMGTRLATEQGSNLYHFWGSQIADYLNAQQASEDKPVVVNLASQEYFKSVDRKVLRARVIDCSFEDYKNGQYKTISFYAKKARGLMARYAIEQQIKTPTALKNSARPATPSRPMPPAMTISCSGAKSTDATLMHNGPRKESDDSHATPHPGTARLDH